jgi:hypothetical protein
VQNNSVKERLKPKVSTLTVNSQEVPSEKENKSSDHPHSDVTSIAECLPRTYVVDVTRFHPAFASTCLLGTDGQVIYPSSSSSLSASSSSASKAFISSSSLVKGKRGRHSSLSEPNGLSFGSTKIENDDDNNRGNRESTRNKKRFQLEEPIPLLKPRLSNNKVISKSTSFSSRDDINKYDAFKLPLKVRPLEKEDPMKKNNRVQFKRQKFSSPTSSNSDEKIDIKLISTLTRHSEDFDDFNIHLTNIAEELMFLEATNFLNLLKLKVTAELCKRDQVNINIYIYNILMPRYTFTILTLFNLNLFRQTKHYFIPYKKLFSLFR